MQRGQFALSGTLMVDGKATAFLREVNGGKSRRVTQGESVNGMVVAEIRPDRVRLTLGDESEELALKVAVGPKTTIQPRGAGRSGHRDCHAGSGRPGQPGTVPQAGDVATILAERRRAARAAEPPRRACRRAPRFRRPAPAQATGVEPATPSAPANPNTAIRNGRSVYQRYQQPRGR